MHKTISVAESFLAIQAPGALHPEGLSMSTSPLAVGLANLPRSRRWSRREQPLTACSGISCRRRRFNYALVANNSPRPRPLSPSAEDLAAAAFGSTGPGKLARPTMALASQANAVYNDQGTKLSPALTRRLHAKIFAVTGPAPEPDPEHIGYFFICRRRSRRWDG